MFMRRAASVLLRRVRFSSRKFSVTSETTFNERPTSAFAGRMNIFCQDGFRNYSWRLFSGDPLVWILISGHVAVLFGMNASPVLAKDASNEINPKNGIEGSNTIELEKVEDGSLVSNMHTSKWRIFTDNARDLFLQGKMEEAESLFLSAVDEAREGFGQRDPHVASACNNLAELYRVQKEFGKAEPLYLEAISILEESFGPEDIRVGSTLHNLGQFYLVQRNLEEARLCYERALKIKGRVLGYGHSDYAETMYHLGMVFFLQGKEKDAEALIKDSIRILEEGGQGESFMCIRRLRYLSQMYLKSDRLADAEIIQRKILHKMELSEGWNCLSTVVAAEGLALTLQSSGNLKEAQELLERCLSARRSLLPDDHIQIGANMLHIARVGMLHSSRLRNIDLAAANNELDKAKGYLYTTQRIAHQILKNLTKQIGKSKGSSADSLKEGRAALIILLQSLDVLGILEIAKQEQHQSLDDNTPATEAEKAYVDCISAYTEFKHEKSIAGAPEVKVEYLVCLKHLSSLIGDKRTGRTMQMGGYTLQELKSEIELVEGEISSRRKNRK